LLPASAASRPGSRLKHRAVADSLAEAGDRLFTFTRLPPSQWRSVRTTNAIERLHEEFKRRIKTQTVLPSADTAAMLFWALTRLRPDQHAQGRWLANARHQAHRSANWTSRLDQVASSCWRSRSEFQPLSGRHRMASSMTLFHVSTHGGLCSLFDHLVGAGEQPRRDLEVERFGGLEVYHQLANGPLLPIFAATIAWPPSARCTC
jgi:Transposase, Mutator family